MATFTVTNTNDSGAGSLRQAILDANNTPGADFVEFDSTLSGTITLTSGQLAVTDSLTLTGPGANVLTVSGNNSSRVFEIDDGNFEVESAVSISGLTISDGSANFGGGIDNEEDLTLTDSTISGNLADSSGGGIRNSGRLRLANSSVSNNSAPAHSGAGIRNSFGSLVELSNSTVASNDGDGIYNDGTLELSNSTVASNDGDGIANFFSSLVELSNSTVASNDGDGIYNDGGTVHLSNSTISNNGAGIDNQYEGSIALTNSTIASNVVGIATVGVSAYDYSGFGGSYSYSLELRLANSIIADNIYGDFSELIYGTPNAAAQSRIILEGTNLIEDGSIAGLNRDPDLGPLQDNGGPTLTHALGDNSPAIDAGDNSVAPDGTSDQRGSGFNRVVNGTVDLGAIERQDTPTPTIFFERNDLESGVEPPDELLPNDFESEPDFNGDGILDRVEVAEEFVRSQGDTDIYEVSVSLFLGDGVGRFGSETKLVLGENTFSYTDTDTDGMLGYAGYNISLDPSRELVGDFNGDGISDLAIAGQAGNLDVYFYFASSYRYGESGQLRGKVAILLGSESGTFDVASHSEYTNYADRDLVLGDFDGDGNLDAVASGTRKYYYDGFGGTDTGLSILLGDGSGGFRSNRSVRATPLPSDLLSGDFNGDGISDLAIATAEDNTVEVRFGDPDELLAGLSTAIEVGDSPTTLASGDFDDDGARDLLVRNGDDTFSILTNVIPQAPTARNDESITPADTPVTIPVLSNDREPDGEDLRLTIISTPNNGQAVIDDNGTPDDPNDEAIVYTPDEGFLGADALEYQIEDDSGNIDTATVTILVGNQPPVARDDLATTAEGVPISIAVLDNDSDPEGDPLSLSIVAAPENGTAEIDGDLLRYAPSGTFSGEDRIEYQIDDGNGNTAIATVFVTVTAETPIANDETVIAVPGEALSIDVLSNDSDPNGDPLTLSLLSPPSQGTAVVDGDFILYTPDADAQVEDQLEYQIEDSDGRTATAAVVVTLRTSDVVVVDTLVDESDSNLTDGDISLRDAIASVATGGTILFDSSLSGGTISLTAGEIAIGRPMAIDGQDLDIRIDAGGSSRVLVVGDGDFESEIAVSLAGLTLTGGRVDGTDGGGIFNRESLSLTNSTVSGNSADFGGGIYNRGTMTIAYSTVSGNSATFADYVYYEGYVYSYGGGIHNRGAMTIANSAVSGNSADYGGGIHNRGAMTIANSAVSGNSAGYGGGIYNRGGTLAIANSAVSGNLAGRDGGGIYNRGAMTIANSAVSGNSASEDGGGIRNFGTLAIAYSTVSGNSAASYAYGDGGGIDNRGTMTIANSTVSGNSASSGGGIDNSGTLAIANSTVSGNSAGSNGGGIDNSSFGSSLGQVTLVSTIAANNVSNFSNPDLFDDGDGGTIAASFSLIEDGELTDDLGNNILGQDPLLGPLQDNGGPTETQVLLAGSPAIDAGSNPDGLSFDQRGPNFPRTFNGQADIGAVEFLDGTPVANDDSASTNEDTAFTFSGNLLANDFDLEGDPLSAIALNGDEAAIASPTLLPSGALVTVETDGSFTYDPNGAFESLNPGDSAIDTFEYTIDDGNGNTATAVVEIAIAGVNDRPTSSNDRPLPGSEFAVSGVFSTINTTATIDVLANDSDLDGDDLTIIDVTPPVNGGTVVNLGNAIEYTPATDFVGQDRFEYTISDSNGGTDTATVVVSVANDGAPTATNDRPLPDSEFVVPGIFGITTNSTANLIEVLANDSDPNGDDLTLSLVSQPSNGTAAIDDNGTPDNPNDDAIVYTPADGFIGQDRFEYQIDDGNGGTDTATVVVAVSAPVIAEMGRIEGLTDAPQTIALQHDFVDPVVIVQPLSRNGGQTAIARFTDLDFDTDTDSFTVRVQETNASVNAGTGGHNPEEVSYLVVEKGTWQLDDGSLLEVGSLEVAGEAIAGFDTVDFAAPFADTPVVLSQVQTNNDTDFVRTRQQNATASGFEVALEEEEDLTIGANGGSDHLTETVGYLAIASGAGTWSGRPYFATTTSDILTEQRERISFEGTFVDDPANPPAPPQVFAALGSYNDSDPAGLRTQSTTAWRVDLRVEEDASLDREQIRDFGESASLLAIQGANLLLEATVFDAV